METSNVKLETSVFKAALLGAVDQAVAEGTIGRLRANMIRRAADNPRKLARMQSHVEEEARCCGEHNLLAAGPNGAIDLNALIEFITKLIPLIAQLLALLGL